MRGTDRQTGHMFSYLSPEALVPRDHPLRLIRPLVNAALERLSGSFQQMCKTEGQINKLKALKRSMYGQAGAELLRTRMLPITA